MNKEELQKQLSQIEEQEHKEMIAEHFPEFRKLIGKCYRVRNCFSCPEKPSDYWWLYKKVIDIKETDLYTSRGDVLASCRVFQFQKDKYGVITIAQEEHCYVHSLDKPISNELFTKEYDALIGEIIQLKNL